MQTMFSYHHIYDDVMRNLELPLLKHSTECSRAMSSLSSLEGKVEVALENCVRFMFYLWHGSHGNWMT